MVNLKIFPQTALLFLIDALRSTEKQYRLDLYLDATSLGGALFELDATGTEGRLLFAENDLQTLMSKFMALLQGAVSEPAPGASAPEHPSDATGVS